MSFPQFFFSLCLHILRQLCTGWICDAMWDAICHTRLGCVSEQCLRCNLHVAFSVDHFFFLFFRHIAGLFIAFVLAVFDVARWPLGLEILDNLHSLVRFRYVQVSTAVNCARLCLPISTGTEAATDEIGRNRWLALRSRFCGF